jgi:hypothetical protein
MRWRPCNSGWPTRDEWLGVVAAVFGLSTLLALTRPVGATHALDGEMTGVITVVTVALLAVVDRG